MTDDTLPAPLCGPDVDVRDLDGFMLNVERLMASELVALSSHEVIAAALFLWCRAWKQTPAASLPDDDRVIAAYSRLPPARYRKLRAEVLRGFVKCKDGRLYHKTLAAEANAAFAKKKSFRDKRDKDAERLRQWRSKQDETRSDTEPETRLETANETHFVAEGQGQGQGQGRDREGQGRDIKKRKRVGRAAARANTHPPPLSPSRVNLASEGASPTRRRRGPTTWRSAKPTRATRRNTAFQAMPASGYSRNSRRRRRRRAGPIATGMPRSGTSCSTSTRCRPGQTAVSRGALRMCEAP